MSRFEKPLLYNTQNILLKDDIQCLVIPEILENIFSYITDYEDIVKLLRVNYTWRIEGVRAILKLYRNKFYWYNHNILNIWVLRNLDCLQTATSKPVYNKVYRPGLEENIHYMDYKEEFEKIQSNAEYSIDELELINSVLLPLDIMKKINYLKKDYRLIVDEIDNILYGNVNDEREPEYLRGDVL